jgi:hypothetical protein
MVGRGRAGPAHLALLVVGMICNELIRHVDPKYHEAKLADDALLARETISHRPPATQP